MPSCSVVGCTSGYVGHKTPPGVTFHSFPNKNPKLVIKWLKKISRKDFVPTKSTKVCSLHFREEDFKQWSSDKKDRVRRKKGELKRRMLKDDAYPTYFPTYPPLKQKKTTPQKPNSAQMAAASARRGLEEEREEFEAVGYQCCALNCKSGFHSRDGGKIDIPQEITFHKFPLHNPELTARWVRKLCTDGFQPTQYSKVCSLHFSNEDFQEIHTDKCGRRQKRHIKHDSQHLTKRTLKPNAVPKFYFECLPGPSEGTETDQGANGSDVKNTVPIEEGREEPTDDPDLVHTIEDVENHFAMMDEGVPHDLSFMKTRNHSLLISLIEIQEPSKIPSLLASLLIEKGLRFSISLFGKPLDNRNFSHIVSETFRTFSEILRIIEELRWCFRARGKMEVPWLEMSVTCMDNFILEKEELSVRDGGLEEQEEKRLRKVAFAREQLAFAQANPNKNCD